MCVHFNSLNFLKLEYVLYLICTLNIFGLFSQKNLLLNSLFLFILKLSDMESDPSYRWRC
jgi:hypothetical protein